MKFGGVFAVAMMAGFLPAVVGQERTKRTDVNAPFHQDKMKTQDSTAEEDSLYWPRLLDEDLDSLPTPNPTPSPTPAPTPRPTEQCDIELDLTCTYGSNMAECNTLTGEEDLVCSCSQCVRELRFKYTANGCDGLEGCVDLNNGPPDVARIVIVDSSNPDDVIYDQNFIDTSDNSDIVVIRESCIPDNLIVSVIETSQGDPNTLTAFQTFVIDTSCAQRGLILLDSYGALDFSGYSCDANDVHNCFVEGTYEVEACNTGSVDLSLSELLFDFNGDISDLISGVPADDLLLSPGECFETTTTGEFELCTDEEYCAKATASAENADGGPVCSTEDEYKFEVMVGSVPPTSSPTPNPTPAPSTPVPTPAPTPNPTPAPTDVCEIDINLQCTPQDGFGETCDDIPIFSQICEERPYQMLFRYTPGDCSQSFNIQNSDLFSCEDFNEKPPTEEGVQSYVAAFELGGGDIYFEGFVNTGELWELTNGLNNAVSANMNITVWDPRGSTDPDDIKSPANILQTVKYHSSCSRNLFLKDRFGNHQLVQWTSEELGLITCFIDASLDITIDIPIDVEDDDPIRLLEMTILHNYEPFVFNRTGEVNGVELGPGDSLEVSPLEVTLDLTTRQRYTFFTTLIGEALDGSSECNGDDFFEFTAGNPLPPIFPTVAPSASPTRSPFPTPDPETTPCNLEAAVSCRVFDASTRNCQQLAVPTILSTCVGMIEGSRDEPDIPDPVVTELKFLYTGENCQNTRPDCRDSNGGPNGAQEVWVEINDRDGDYVAQVIQLGDFVSISNPSGFSRNQIKIEIYLYDPTEDDNRGDRLQRERIEPLCEDNPESLTLGTDYGAMKLTFFQSERDGIQSLYATVQLTYTIENDSVFDAVISSAVKSSFFSGSEELVPGNQAIGRFEEVEIFQESQTLNLEEASQAVIGFLFGLVVEGRRDDGPISLACDDNAVYFFTVAP